MFLVAAILAVVALYKPVTEWREKRRRIRQAQHADVVYFPLKLSTDRTNYWRYAVVTLSIRLVDSKGVPIDTDTPPSVTVKHNGTFVRTVGGIHELKPKYKDADADFIAHWPVPWNADPGEYIATVRWELPESEQWPWLTAEEQVRKGADNEDDPESDVSGNSFCVARAYFYIKAREPRQPHKGMCIATWEEDLPRPGLRMRRPSGEMGGWKTIFEWCEFIGADTLWVRAAITRTNRPPLTMKQPFIQQNLDAIPRIAAEAHRRGLKFGVWAMAYATLPESTNRNKPDYRYARSISLQTGQVEDTGFISFLDRNRPDHLASFIKSVQQDPNVDYIGLDYMRTRPAYELTDGFARTMPVDLPDNWLQMSRGARWKYVARRVQPPGCYTYVDFYDAWNWYRAHLGAGIVAEIAKKAKIKKPLWLFLLSWKHGVQHGQDPLMFTDAGASIIAPMLYEVESAEHYDLIVKEWNAYMKPDQAVLMCGDCADHYMHQRKGPLLLYERMMRAHENFIAGARTKGTFWHDISRAAIAGNMGPFLPREWALAGAAAFSKLRQNWKVYPLRATLNTETNVAIGVPFQLRVTIENICEAPVRDIRIRAVPTMRVKFENDGAERIPTLGPGRKLTIPFTASITQTSAARSNSFLAALRITWDDRDYGEQFDNDLPKVITLINESYIRAR